MAGPAGLNVMWFRRGLRLHDNPALHAALKDCEEFLAIYIFDTTHLLMSPRSGHRYRFLLQSLEDLDTRLRSVGSRLHVFRGCCLDIISNLHLKYGIQKLCFQEDCEPIWKKRNVGVNELCSKLNIRWFQGPSDNLWDPMNMIVANGGSPPLTYKIFSDVVGTIGDPARPVESVSWSGIHFCNISTIDRCSFEMFDGVPTLARLGVADKSECRLLGGETEGLLQLSRRLKVEEAAFRSGFYQPNNARPDILGNSNVSLSAAVSLGCVSVRLFYWKLRDLYDEVKRGNPPFWSHITGQLIWREFFYTMGRANPRFGKNTGNPACLPIPWLENGLHADLWKKGMTGYPFIDAAMRQLYREGWIHHTSRNAVSIFLTRGCLWLNWEIGAELFEELLVDYDWAISAGNYMWVCSTAFEGLLNSSKLIDPVLYGKRLEPSGDYIRRYVSELEKFEFEYIHEPWKAPLHVQEAANCIIGRDYPERMVIHEEVSGRNQRWMAEQRHELVLNMKSMGDHCQPSSEKEIYQFFRLVDDITDI